MDSFFCHITHYKDVSVLPSLPLPCLSVWHPLWFLVSDIWLRHLGRENTQCKAGPQKIRSVENIINPRGEEGSGPGSIYKTFYLFKYRGLDQILCCNSDQFNCPKIDWYLPEANVWTGRLCYLSSKRVQKYKIQIERIQKFVDVTLVYEENIKVGTHKVVLWRFRQNVSRFFQK